MSVHEVFETNSVETKWNAMRETWRKATEQICRWTEGSERKSADIICRSCKVDRLITDLLNTDLHLDIGDGVSLEKVVKFCF